ncbi:MAG: glycosyltransferase family 4 protein [Bacteroidales bacterium]|nr:glycosyltransferase family 4 protein [Bacteroidales bacterium]
MKKTKIVFYSRKDVVARGDFALYSRIGAELAENENYTVYYVNNPDATIRAQYRFSNLIYTSITEKNKKDFEGAIFIFPINTLFCLLEEIRDIKDAKLLCVLLHPNTLDWLANQTVKRWFDMSKLVNLLKQTNAYAVQDGDNLLKLEGKIGQSLEPRFFPVMMETPDSETIRLSLKNIEDKVANIAWLGRLDGDKIYSVINFLDNLYEALGEKTAKFHIIGDGNAVTRINISKYTPKIQIVFCSYLFGEKRDKYIMENADFVVAMGMSAIEIAPLKVPVVLPIVSPSPFREDVFLYLYETKYFCPGWSLDGFAKASLKGRTCEIIINDIYAEEKKVEIGQKCYDYAIENFSVNKNAEKVLQIIERTTLTVEQIRKEPIVKRQLTLFNLYRRFVNKNANWNRYLLFLDKFKLLMKRPKREIVKTVIKKLKEALCAKKRK